MTTIVRCARCNDPLELPEPEQTHCLQCQREVAGIIARDTARRIGRGFPEGKDLTTLGTPL